MPDRAAKIQRQFGAAVRAERKVRGYTQQQLAARAQLSLNYIGEIERGGRMVTLITLQRLAAALNLTTADLVLRAGV